MQNNTEDEELNVIVNNNDENDEQQPGKQKQQHDEKYQHMSEQQKRLFNLRMKRNQCRKQNLEEVAQENQLEGFLQKRKNRLDTENANRVAKGADPLSFGGKIPFFQNKKRKRESEQSVDITAEDADFVAQREKKKRQLAHSQQSDPFYFEYRKKTTGNISEKQVQNYHQVRDQQKVDGLEYGSNTAVSNERMEALVKDLEPKSSEDSRRKRERKNADSRVDYINAGNRKFNKKISQQYDQYTSEIKSNLERGTAL